MNNDRRGYGIYRWTDGAVYYGEFKLDKIYGQGYKRNADGDEYCGEYKNGIQLGEEANEENRQL